MKTLYEIFENDEFEDMKKKKDESGMTWHDFLLVSSGARKKRDLKKK